MSQLEFLSIRYFKVVGGRGLGKINFKIDQFNKRATSDDAVQLIMFSYNQLIFCCIAVNLFFMYFLQQPWEHGLGGGEAPIQKLVNRCICKDSTSEAVVVVVLYVKDSNKLQLSTNPVVCLMKNTSKVGVGFKLWLWGDLVFSCV